MSSSALSEWRESGLSRLRELEDVHSHIAGKDSGRKWSTTQLNRSLFVALVGQFQRFCLELHDEAIAVHRAVAAPAQAAVVEALLVQGRKLDTQNPRVSALGSDFSRLGFRFIDDLKAQGHQTAERLRRLDVLIDLRNAIGHGNDAQIATLVATGDISETKKSYLAYRGTLNSLAGTMDRVVAVELAALLKIDKPW